MSVHGAYHGSERALYAYRPTADGEEEIVGKLNVVSFDEEPRRVHIISVNNARLPSVSELEARLNSIYRQAVCTWTVIAQDPVTLTFPGGKMTHGGSGTASTYNSDQRAIAKAFESSGRQMEPGSLYLFFVEDVTFKDRSLAGYMPLQRQVGFIYGNPTLEVVAHELAHGAFMMRHTFSPKAFIIGEGQTRNLMDYSGGIELWKHQWDLIHNPEKVLFSWAQDEEEGAFSLPCVGWFDDCKDVLKILETFRNARINGNHVKINGQEKPDERVLIANSVKFGDTDYKRLRLIYTPKPEDYLINPVKYDSYDQQFFVADGSVDWQRGFVFYKDKEVLFKILVDDKVSKIEKLKDYLFGKDYDEIKAVFINNSVLTPGEIKDVRDQINGLMDEDQKKELYLELQTKVPYHNQRNNDQTQYIADRMCNLTSQAMCLEYLGISCPDPNMQFEDYLEQIRVDNNYGDRTTQGARKKVAEHLGACYFNETYGRTFSKEREDFEKFVLSKLESGCAVMLSIWPGCKGHLVRLQGVANEGLIVDDPYGKVKGKTDGFDWREACNSGGYDTNSNTSEDTKGNDNFWKWSDIQDVTLKYVEVFCECE